MEKQELSSMMEDLIVQLRSRCEEVGVERLTLERVVELVHGISRQDFIADWVETRWDEVESDLEQLRSTSFRGRREYEKIAFYTLQEVRRLHKTGMLVPVYPGKNFDPAKDEFVLVN